MNQETDSKKPVEIPEQLQTCGIVMPISAIGECTVEHWKDVLNILKDVIKDLGLKGNLVSEADESGIIQKRIIQNLYDNEIVVCDVSGKNPNVMFELGIRLAFDKPTIVIKDDCTDYSFDTSPLEHITYPRDLTYWKILEFKHSLKTKIYKTLEASKESDYSTFLKNFGEFKVAKLDSTTLSKDEYLINAIEELKTEFNSVKRQIRMGYNKTPRKKADDESLIQYLCDDMIRDYLMIHGLNHSEIFNNNDHLNSIADYTEANNRVLCELCGSRMRLMECLKNRITPF